VKHILVECVDLKDVRNKHFVASSVKDLFDNIEAHKIIDFIKETRFYIYIFIHQYGSAQKENTNVQTKKQYKKHINHTQCAFTEHYNIYKMY